MKSAKENTKILAIETSCDETAIAVIESRKTKNEDDFSILSSRISSQVKIHAPFGGVVPNLAKREHQKNLPVLLKRVLREAKLPLGSLASKLDAVAVTVGPGLEPALWQGITFAEDLAKKWKKPLIAVNHLEGHIYSAFMRGDNFSIPPLRQGFEGHAKNIFPLLTLIVSGGHTELVLVKKHLDYKILGETLDDAAGEAFDKVARMLALPYPGGPEISKLAREGSPTSFNFPRPMINSKDLNFSFSGLKTAVLYKIREISESKQQALLEHSQRDGARQAIRQQANMRVLAKLDAKMSADIAASFEQAVVDVLIKKTLNAIEKFKPKTVALGGGVAANDKLREALSAKIPGILLPEKQFTGDNASMIAVAAYFKALKKQFSKMPLKADGQLKL